MSITTRPLGSGSGSDTLMSSGEFPEMIKREEGSSLTAYYDSAGIPTIGIGINLADSSNLSLVLQTIFTNGVPATAQADFEKVLGTKYGSANALDEALNARLKKYSDPPAAFVLTPAQEVSIFTTVANEKVAALNAILQNNGTTIARSSWHCCPFITTSRIVTL